MGQTRIVDTLQPCPFCGATLLRVRHGSRTVNVACPKCAAQGPEADIGRDDAEGDAAEARAVAAWNGRA